MNEDRSLTVEGVRLIQHFESCMKQHGDKFHAYVCPAGVTTIGWGSTGPPHGNHNIDKHTVWTAQQCDDAFISDMAWFEKEVRKAVTVPLTDYQFSALVSFTFNVGAGNLRKSTLLKHVNSGDFADAALEFKKWNKANGKVMKGLIRRRKSEAIMFAGLSDEDFDGYADDPMPQAVDDADGEAKTAG
jgi:lysozyme